MTISSGRCSTPPSSSSITNRGAHTPACRVETHPTLGTLLALLLLPPSRSSPSRAPSQLRRRHQAASSSAAVFGCHNAGEMRAGLNLETFAGVMKGGGSGDVVIAGRPSIQPALQSGLAHEAGVPQMPLGQAKLPDAEIAVIRDWIQLGLLETAASKPQGPMAPARSISSHPRSTSPTAPAMPADSRRRGQARSRSAGRNPGDRVGRQSVGAHCWPSPDTSASISMTSTTRTLLGELRLSRRHPIRACASAATAPRCWPPAAKACNPARSSSSTCNTGKRIATIGQ